MKNEEIFIKKIGKKVPAILGLREAKLLFSLVKGSIPEGVIVEIGSFMGGSTILLAKASKIANKRKVYAIDPFDTYFPTSLKNIKNAGVDDWIIPITKTSIKAAKNWKKPISLLFIDGNHSYGYVKTDFLLWEKYLVKGGIIAFHDSQRISHPIRPDLPGRNKDEGPIWVVEENILHSRRFGNIKKVDSMTVAQKIERRSFGESFRDTCRLYWLKMLTPQLVTRLFLICKEIDRRIGQIGIFLKRKNPRLYYALKKIKK